MHAAGRIGRQHARALAVVERADRAADEAREAAAAEWQNRCVVGAAQYYEVLELQRAEAAIREARQEREAQRERERQVAAAGDYRQMLLATGQGRLRTVDEVLASMRWG
jgi:hypothetical protein